MNAPRTTTEHSTHTSKENGISAHIWNTNSPTHPFRVIFRDDDAAEVVYVIDYPTETAALKNALKFVK